MPFKLRWKKPDFNYPGYLPYSFRKKDLPQLRGPDNYPLLIPRLEDNSPIAKRYRDQVRKDEIEKISNIHLKMYEFRKDLTDNFKIDIKDQPRGSLPYWQFATQTRLFRGLPERIAQMAREMSESDNNEVSEILSHCINDFLSQDADYRIKHEIEDRSHITKFLQSLASSLLFSSSGEHLHGRSCINHDVEVCGLFGKDEFTFQTNDHSTVFHIRSQNPLDEVVSLDSEYCQYSDDIPRMKSKNGDTFNPELYERKVWENPKTRKTRKPRKLWVIPPEKPEPDIFPGYKVESSCPFVHTQFIQNDYSPPFWSKDSPEMRKFYHQEVQDARVLLNLFSVTSSIAWFLGFTPYQDLTSPIVCNAVCSDGTSICFYTFQLNTVALGKLVCQEFNPSEYNTRANVLWRTDNIPLFAEANDEVEINPVVPRILQSFISQETYERQFEVPKSSWDPLIPEGTPLVKQVKEEDPGYLKIKMRKPKNRDMRYYEPLYASKK